ncbi:hypothetical protein GCM10022389_22790 [Flavobacterium cheonanense]|uniref:Glycosyltransferase 2-like domain-containing protein n=1 Tax=Flavobacterium cheonanense TaxID=706183 RepID=A0ABP7VY15_9FLAO
MTPKISIIIPVYNVAQYLGQCIDSVMNQSYKNIEIILINDGSTDTSSSICESYVALDSRIHLFHQVNGGLSVARNTGLKNATGDYIWFVDSDDWIAPDALELLFSTLQSMPYEVVGFSNFDYYEDKDGLTEAYNIQEINKTTGTDFINQSSFFFTSACCFIYSHQFLKQNKLQFAPGLMHEDDYFNLSCFGSISSCCKLPVALYYYRRRQGSITTAVNMENLKKRVVSYSKLIDLCKRVDNLDPNFLKNKRLAYEKVIIYLLNSFLEGASSFNSKIEFTRFVQKSLPKVTILKTDYNYSKAIWLQKKLYNMGAFFYCSYFTIVKKG